MTHRGLFVSFFPGNHLSSRLAQRQQGRAQTSGVTTGTVNNFINRPRPLLIEQKHTNNMEKHFLFLMSPHRLCHLKVGYPVCP